MENSLIDIKRLSPVSLALCILLLSRFSIQAQSADLQFIHNSSDPALEVVDVWVDGSKVIDNLAFRNASSTISFPLVGTTLLHVCDSSSVDTTNSLIHWSDSLADSSQHQFVLQGLVQAGGFSVFQPLGLAYFNSIPENANISGNTDVRWVNGITDGGALSIEEIKLGFGFMLQGFSYGMTASNEAYTTSNYRIHLSNNNDNLGQFELDLSAQGLEDRALTIAFTGFRQPDNNNNGASIQIIGFEADGTRHIFNRSLARVQWIHNSPDPAIPAIDIYRDGDVSISDLAFRAATGYTAVPAGVDWNVEVRSEGSSSTLVSRTLYLEADRNYVAVVNGNAESGFSVERPLSIEIRNARRLAQLGATTDVLFFNGSPDFANARLFESSALDDFLFGATDFGLFSGYSAMPFTDYKLDLIDEVDNSLFATYDLILSQFNLEGQAITLMTSGFRDTASNKNGPALGLWFARSTSGLMVELPMAVGINDDPHETPTCLLYPQPAQDRVHLRSEEAIRHAYVFDAFGNLVQEETGQARQMELCTSKLPSGMYVLHIELENGASLKRKMQVVH
jgi:hypothetical protein